MQNAEGYIGQPRNSHICVPVAIHNAIRWAGNFEVDTKTLLGQLIKECKTEQTAGNESSHKLGTRRSGTRTGIGGRAEFVCSEEINCPTLPNIRKHIQSGGAVILCYKNKRKWYNGHAVFVDKYYKDVKAYRVINGPGTTINEPFGTLTNTEMSKILNRKGMYYKPHAWFIRRK